jgi:hypothetical protein
VDAAVRAEEDVMRALKDLDFAQQVSKAGLLQQTTKCCATGTRTAVSAAVLDAPVVVSVLDDTDPRQLRAQLPPLDD